MSKRKWKKIIKKINFIKTHKRGYVSIGWREQNNYMKWCERYPDAKQAYANA